MNRKNSFIFVNKLIFGIIYTYLIIIRFIIYNLFKYIIINIHDYCKIVIIVNLFNNLLFKVLMCYIHNYII